MSDAETFKSNEPDPCPHNAGHPGHIGAGWFRLVWCALRGHAVKCLRCG